MSPADNMPDFDSMSPDEITAWLETLAKRQGAVEGFTTEANVDIAEIDPDSVVIDEPGYIPYGQEAAYAAAKAEAAAAPPAATKPPSPLPAAPAAVKPPATPPPAPYTAPVADTTRYDNELTTTTAASVDAGALAWLESLAADQDDGLFNLDLGVSEEVASEPTNPVSWLEDLARSQGEFDVDNYAMPSESARITAPVTAPGESESLEWLETLARRQGVNEDELITSASLDIPRLDEEDVETPTYTPFSFDSPMATRSAPPVQDPAAFLDSLASEQGYDEAGVRGSRFAPEDDYLTEPNASESMSLESIAQAIGAGTVTSEQMQYWMDQNTDSALADEAVFADENVEMPTLDLDAPAVAGDLPDWLIEQLGSTPAEAAPPPRPQIPLEQLFAESGSTMPAWLREDMDAVNEFDMEALFDTEDSPIEIETSAPEREYAMEVNVDPNDPWVEAFDNEYEQGQLDISQIPEWYDRNLNDPARVSAVERLGGYLPEAASANGLVDAPLPVEMSLSLGEREAVPEWLTQGFIPEGEPLTHSPVQPQAAAPETAIAEEDMPLIDAMPDWLRELESDVPLETVPDWLMETLQDAPPAVETPAPIAPRPAPLPPHAPRPTPEPVPTPAPPPVYRGTAAIESARAKVNAGDLNNALMEYEQLIRANDDLETVVDDLSSLARVQNTPATWRVLGDGLMRQGKLQDALNTYRQALNQLS